MKFYAIVLTNKIDPELSTLYPSAVFATIEAAQKRIHFESMEEAYEVSIIEIGAVVGLKKEE